MGSVSAVDVRVAMHGPARLRTDVVRCFSDFLIAVARGRQSRPSTWSSHSCRSCHQLLRPSARYETCEPAVVRMTRGLASVGRVLRAKPSRLGWALVFYERLRVWRAHACYLGMRPALWSRWRRVGLTRWLCVAVTTLGACVCAWDVACVLCACARTGLIYFVRRACLSFTGATA